jgi:hypothetical protein
MDDADSAQLIAAAVMAALLALLALVGRKVWVVTADTVSYTPPGGDASRELLKGTTVPDDEASAAKSANPGGVGQVRRSWFSAIVVGGDNRTSTSKSVAFAWTLALAWGLLSLLIASWLGDHSGWDAQMDKGIQEEYLLLLGGPYAAAVLARINAVSEAGTEGNPPAAMGAAGPSQLVTNDEGDADLGDFQYVLFNLIGLAYFIGDFAADAGAGFPELPAVLAGLVLTSVGGYTAKKLISHAQPTLTSAVPATTAAGGSIQLYGLNLLIPASVSPTGVTMPPEVSIGGKPATITAYDQILGADRLTISIDLQATVGAGTIAVVRADGVPAVGPAGADGLPFTIA